MDMKIILVNHIKKRIPNQVFYVPDVRLRVHAQKLRPEEPLMVGAVRVFLRV